MKISFETKNLHGLTLSQFFYLLFCEANKDKNENIDTVLDFLQNNGFISEHRQITETGKELIQTILLEKPEIQIENLTKELRELYPKGLKPGTNYKWTSNPKEITNKLKRFFLLFKEEDITEEEVIQATKNYLQKMEYDVHMRLLKYFILKANADRDNESDLYTEICLIREGDNHQIYENECI